MNIFAKAAALEQENTPFALASITETSGSTPRHNGQMLITQDGATWGTIGGGMIERHIIEQAQQAISESKARTVHGRMTRNGTDAMGMDCGGAMSVFIAVYGQRPKLFLIGGGHVNRAIAGVAHKLGFSLTVADAYQQSLKEQLFPPATLRVAGNTMAEAIEQLDIDPQSFVVIATNHQDQEAISSLVRYPTRYTGLMASSRKVQTLFNALRQQGVSEAQIQAIHSPVGFDIGAETPEEIAISVMAEILKVKNQAAGGQLKDQQRPKQPRQITEQDQKQSKRVYIRGAGDIATGVAVRLHHAGFQVVMAETEQPTVIRRSVAFATAVYAGETEVEGIQARRADTVSQALSTLEHSRVAVVTDPEAAMLSQLRPRFVVDAILAKQNLGTRRDMAPITVALGPGFTAGEDCDAVIETNRGHHLGRVLYQGQTQANTGIPGNIAGYTHQRVLRAPKAGVMHNQVELGDLVSEGDLIATINDTPLYAPLSGMVRGLLHDGLEITEGFKVGDIDPRGSEADHTTVSDKARAIAGSVLEAMLCLSQQTE